MIACPQRLLALLALGVGWQVRAWLCPVLLSHLLPRLDFLRSRRENGTSYLGGAVGEVQLKSVTLCQSQALLLLLLLLLVLCSR